MAVIIDGVQANAAPNAAYNLAVFAKPDVTVAGSSGAWTTANSPITLFTVTGTVKCKVYGIVGATGLTSTGGTGTLAINAAGGNAVLIAATTVSGGSQFAAGNAWVNTTPTGTTVQPAAANLNGVIDAATAIQIAIATNNMTAGSMTIYCEWIPVSAGATVVAATP